MITSELNFQDNINMEFSKHDVQLRKLLDFKQFYYLFQNAKTCLKRYVKFNIKNYEMD